MTIELITLTEPNPVFYAALGPFLGNIGVTHEIGAPPLQSSSKTWVVALEEGFPVGMAAVYLNKQEPNLPAELSGAYVIERKRGRGIYSRLVEKRLCLVNEVESWWGDDKPVLVRTSNPRVIQCLLHYDFSLGLVQDGLHQLTRDDAQFTPRERA